MSGFERRLAAVWFADMVGYTRLTGEDEDQAFALVGLLQQQARSLIAEHGGRLVKCIGDAVLAEFRSTEAAIQAALALRDRFAEASRGQGSPAQLRIGMHIGDVRATADGDVYGDGVNTASRLQSLAEPGQVVVSQDVWRQLRPRVEYEMASLGEHRIKGMQGNLWAFRVDHRRPTSAAAAVPPDDPLPHPHPGRRILAVARSAALFGAASLLVLQLIGTLYEAWDLPSWVIPAAMALLGIGFLIVLLTAWMESRPAWRRPLAARPRGWDIGVGDLSESISRRRLPELTWPRALWGGLAVFALLLGTALMQSRVDIGSAPLLRPQAAHATSLPSIAVLPFETDSAAGEIWREGVPDLIAISLNASGQLRVVDPRMVLHRMPADQARLTGTELLQLGRGVDARYLIRGRMTEADRRVTLEAEVYDVRDGRLLGLATVDGEPDQIAFLVDRLATRALQIGLGEEPAEQRTPLTRLATGSIPALQAYLRGEQLYRQSRWVQARQELQEAVRLSPTFALAHYRLALTEAWSEMPHLPRPDRASLEAERNIDRLPERDSLRIVGLAQLNRGDPAAVRTLEELVRRYPDDVDGWFLLGDARYHLGGPAAATLASDALQRAIRLDPGYGPAYIHLIDEAVAARDSVQLRRWLAEYRRADPGSPVLSGFDWALRLSSGSGVAEAPPEPATREPAPPPQRTAAATRPTPRRDAPPVEQPAGPSPAVSAQLDSLARVVGTETARPDFPPSAAREVTAWMEASRQAQAANRFDQAVAHARRAADAATAARPAAQPEPPPSRGTQQPEAPPAAPARVPERAGRAEVAGVLATLERAIESKDIARMQRVWTSLSAQEIDSFRQSLPGMTGLDVSFEVLEITPEGESATARVRTTYRYQDGRGRHESQSFVQRFRIARSGDAWVIVDSSTG